MTPEDWSRGKSTFMTESAELQAAKRRRVERIEDMRTDSTNKAPKSKDEVKANLEMWSACTKSIESTVSFLTDLIPWYFPSLHPQMTGKALGAYFQKSCVEAIKSISALFFSDSGQGLPEVKHHHYATTNHIGYGVSLFTRPTDENWKGECLAWYQRFLGMCLAIKFHRKADVCTRVIVNRGTRISTPANAPTWQEVRISEVDFYSTLWAEVTSLENFEKWYKIADSTILIASGKLGSNSGPTMVKSGSDLNQTKAGARANPDNTMSGQGNARSL